MENAENALILLYDLCRLCLDEPGVDNIFEPFDWSDDILFYTGIKVTTADKLPQTICTSCRDIMTCVKVLKDIASTNETRLHQISGYSDGNQVLVTESPKHLIIITPHTNDQDSSDDKLKNRLVFESEDEDISQAKKQSSKKRKSSSTSERTSDSSVLKLKNRLVFESEDEDISQTEKQSRKKRKSSSTSERTSSAPKFISIRKDLFDASASVTSTKMKKRNEYPSSTSNPSKDRDSSRKASSSSSKIRKQSPTSTSSNEPTKVVKVGQTELKVHKYEFECETCKKTYATHKKLYLHQFAHNKKFQCPLDVCDKKFATKGDLQKHIRSHTGEKPYKCNLCDLTFTQNVSLKAHKEKLHNEPLLDRSLKLS